VECSARFPFRSLERRLVLQLCTTAGCERAAISLGETNAHFPGSPVQAKVLAKYDVVVCTMYNYTLHHFLRVRSHVFAPFDPLAHWCKYLYLYILYLKRMSCIYIYITSVGLLFNPTAAKRRIVLISVPFRPKFLREMIPKADRIEPITGQAQPQINGRKHPREESDDERCSL
jgi:hypothetical protein